MGRHSSREQAPYYQSIVGWFLPWLLVAAVAVTGVWLGVSAIGGDAASPPPPQAASKPAPADSPATQKTPAASTEPGPKETKQPEAKEEPRADKKAEPNLITSGITVQVLNGTRLAEAGTRMAEKLESLGFEVGAINPANSYARTTVYWSLPSAERAAKVLAARFGWAAAPKPVNLSSAVSIHVVIGADEAQALS